MFGGAPSLTAGSQPQAAGITQLADHGQAGGAPSAPQSNAAAPAPSADAGESNEPATPGVITASDLKPGDISEGESPWGTFFGSLWDGVKDAAWGAAEMVLPIYDGYTGSLDVFYTVTGLNVVAYENPWVGAVLEGLTFVNPAKRWQPVSGVGKFASEQMTFGGASAGDVLSDVFHSFVPNAATFGILGTINGYEENETKGTGVFSRNDSRPF